MKKLLFASLLLFASNAFATLICNVNLGTGLKECGWYGLTVPTMPGQQFSTTYAQIVPPGESRQIHITHASVNPNVANPNMSGQHILLVESPADSGHWSVPLCWQREANGVCRDAFNPGVIMGPGDELCLQSYSGSAALASQVSYAIYFTIGP